MSISNAIKDSIERSSWIRKMFEQGARLKSEFGEENVCDFSLGNPDVEPPHRFFTVLQNLAASNAAGAHGYMPNAGFNDVRSAVAKKTTREHGLPIPPECILMTCGAAGGLNVVLKTILNPGEEIIVPRPYFVEYGFYISNHNGVMKLVDTNHDFSLNIDSIAASINPMTKAVLINSPNNPTARIYSEKEISDLAALLNTHRKRGQIIYLLSDEPYREIIYDSIGVPSTLNLYSESIVVTSYSKTLSIPGERIGFIAVNPTCSGLNELMAGLILSNRILGFVNAPALMQRVIAELIDETVDVKEYQERRDLLTAGFDDAGYQYAKPQGTFYLFCKSPLDDDIAFVQHLLKYKVLVVPGAGFGGPGYFRISYCVSKKVIERSLPLFKKALQELTS